MKFVKAGTRILDLRDSPWVDGPGRTILDCASSLREQGLELVVGTFGGGKQQSNDYAEEALRRNLPVRVLQERGPFDLRVVGQLVRLIHQMNIDLLHSHDFRSNVFGLIAAKICRKPIVTTVHGWIANDIKGRAYVAMDKLLLRQFSHVITVSERTRSLVSKSIPDAGKTSVIPNALILDKYVPDRSDDAFRRELVVAQDMPLIANIGRLSPEKGQLAFLHAVKRLVEKGVKARFVLIGIGPDQEMLQRYVNENGLADMVAFAGFRSNMITIYNSIDLVIQSSYTEGMPNVMLEALLMEVPVIATDVGGTAEVVKDHQTGILIRPDSVDQIVEQISDHIQYPDRLLSMARKGRQDVSSRFDHRSRVDRLSALYSRVLRDH
jgi:glycosyltransferase involved in cell wall biosynthesis